MFFPSFPINSLFPSSQLSTPITMSSTTAAMGSSPSEGSSPFVSVNWNLYLFGPEAYPPFLGDGEFAIINPDFWGAPKEEQEAMKGWYMFHAVFEFSAIKNFHFTCQNIF